MFFYQSSHSSSATCLYWIYPRSSNIPSLSILMSFTPPDKCLQKWTTKVFTFCSLPSCPRTMPKSLLTKRSKSSLSVWEIPTKGAQTRVRKGNSRWVRQPFQDQLHPLSTSPVPPYKLWIFFFFSCSGFFFSAYVFIHMHTLYSKCALSVFKSYLLF